MLGGAVGGRLGTRNSGGGGGGFRLGTSSSSREAGGGHRISSLRQRDIFSHTRSISNGSNSSVTDYKYQSLIELLIIFLCIVVLGGSANGVSLVNDAHSPLTSSKYERPPNADFPGLTFAVQLRYFFNSSMCLSPAHTFDFDAWYKAHEVFENASLSNTKQCQEHRERERQKQQQQGNETVVSSSSVAPEATATGKPSPSSSTVMTIEQCLVSKDAPTTTVAPATAGKSMTPPPSAGTAPSPTSNRKELCAAAVRGALQALNDVSLCTGSDGSVFQVYQGVKLIAARPRLSSSEIEPLDSLDYFVSNTDVGYAAQSIVRDGFENFARITSSYWNAIANGDAPVAPFRNTDVNADQACDYFNGTAILNDLRLSRFSWLCGASWARLDSIASDSWAATVVRLVAAIFLFVGTIIIFSGGGFVALALSLGPSSSRAQIGNSLVLSLLVFVATWLMMFVSCILQFVCFQQLKDLVPYAEGRTDNSPLTTHGSFLCRSTMPLMLDWARGPVSELQAIFASLASLLLPAVFLSFARGFDAYLGGGLLDRCCGGDKTSIQAPARQEDIEVPTIVGIDLNQVTASSRTRRSNNNNNSNANLLTVPLTGGGTGSSSSARHQGGRRGSGSASDNDDATTPRGPIWIVPDDRTVHVTVNIHNNNFLNTGSRSNSARSSAGSRTPTPLATPRFGAAGGGDDDEDLGMYRGQPAEQQQQNNQRQPMLRLSVSETRVDECGICMSEAIDVGVLIHTGLNSVRGDLSDHKLCGECRNHLVAQAAREQKTQILCPFCRQPVLCQAI